MATRGKDTPKKAPRKKAAGPHKSPKKASTGTKAAKGPRAAKKAARSELPSAPSQTPPPATPEPWSPEAAKAEDLPNWSVEPSPAATPEEKPSEPLPEAKPEEAPAAAESWQIVEEEPTPAFSPAPSEAPASEPPAPQGAGMAQAPASEPAPSTPATQWTPVEETPAAPAATTPAGVDDRWVALATWRRGIPAVAALGWLLIVLGGLVFALTYYWGYYYGVLMQPAGVRGDYIAAILMFIGILLVIVFHFVPAKRQFGLSTDAQQADFNAAARSAHSSVRMGQIFVGVGVGLVIVGIIWVAYYVRLAYFESGLRFTNIGGRDVATFDLGVVFVLIGLCALLFAWGAIGPSRRARNLAVVAAGRQPAPVAAAAPSGRLASGVTEQDVANLMKRLDVLMAQLPETAVTDFSKTPEADTYLKLLGS